MLQSEKRSLYRFMATYLFSTMLLFIIGAIFFYKYEQSSMIEQQKEKLKQEALLLMPIIKQQEIEKINALKGMKVAAYNGKKSYVFGNFTPAYIDWNQTFVISNKTIRYLTLTPPPHRRHIAFVLLEREIERGSMPHLKRVITLAILLAFVLLLLLGYFLGRLFVAPMRETLERMNHFIQDTTHELNTPVATILSNVEMMEILGKCKESKELKRIEIASKTLSRIYEDLSYLKLNEHQQKEIQRIDFSILLKDRLTYFSASMEAKGISLKTKIEEAVIKEADKTDLYRLFDNLISNAIKYNNHGGNIDITLTTEAFVIKDSGRGMSKAMQQKVFDRFQREDRSEGGFGIGLNIVSQICTYYHYTIDVTSILGKGSTIAVRFEKA